MYVLKRPHVDEFLQRMGQWFECILFTASLAKVRTHTRTVLVLVHNPNKLRAKAKVSRVLANAQYLIRQMSFAFSLLLLVSSRLVSYRARQLLAVRGSRVGPARQVGCVSRASVPRRVRVLQGQLRQGIKELVHTVVQG